MAGLLAVCDLLAARGSIEGDFLIVPEQACLKSGNVFLDDLTMEDLEGELQMPVAHGGASLMSLIGNATDLEQRVVNAKTATARAVSCSSVAAEL